MRGFLKKMLSYKRGLRVNFLPHFLSVAVKMLSAFFGLSKSYG